jgi:hypothetical protein
VWRWGRWEKFRETGSFFLNAERGDKKTPVLMGKMKNDKWVRLVIFCFVGAGFTRIARINTNLKRTG